MNRRATSRQRSRRRLEYPPADETPLTARQVLQHQQRQAAERRGPDRTESRSATTGRTDPDSGTPRGRPPPGRPGPRSGPAAEAEPSAGTSGCAAYVSHDGSVPALPAGRRRSAPSSGRRPECPTARRAARAAARECTRRSPSDRAAQSARGSRASLRSRWSSRRRNDLAAPPAAARRETRAADDSRAGRPCPCRCRSRRGTACNRCCSAARRGRGRAASTANGISVTAAPPILPVKKASSSCSVPRATVPSTSGRALDPSRKNSDARSGLYFGWLCMSWRQPAPTGGRRQQQETEGGRQRHARGALTAALLSRRLRLNVACSVGEVAC